MILVEKNVTAKVLNISTYYKETEVLEVSLELVSGANIGTRVTDKVSFFEGHRLNWKYHALRNSAGLKRPIGFEVLEDARKALIGKLVNIDLSEFKYTDYRGNPDSCQSIKYKLKCCELSYNKF